VTSSSKSQNADMDPFAEVEISDYEPQEPEEGETYEVYEVYVDSGSADEQFREFCKSLGSAVEISWKDTNYV
jgi:hypothetical protein